MPIEPASILAAAAATAGVATVAVLAESVPLDGAILVTPEVIQILAHKTLRLYCLLGSIGGGVLAAALTSTAGTREMAWKWTVGVIAGLLFTPWLIRSFNVEPAPDTIVAAAGAVALLAWGCLHKLIPVLEKMFVGKVRRIIGDTSDPTPPARP